jgi:hypothetical protein
VMGSNPFCPKNLESLATSIVSTLNAQDGAMLKRLCVLCHEVHGAVPWESWQACWWFSTGNIHKIFHYSIALCNLLLSPATTFKLIKPLLLFCKPESRVLRAQILHQLIFHCFNLAPCIHPAIEGLRPLDDGEGSSH